MAIAPNFRAAVIHIAAYIHFDGLVPRANMLILLSGDHRSWAMSREHWKGTNSRIHVSTVSQVIN